METLHRLPLATASAESRAAKRASYLLLRGVLLAGGCAACLTLLWGDLMTCLYRVQSTRRRGSAPRATPGSEHAAARGPCSGYDTEPVN